MRWTLTVSLVCCCWSAAQHNVYELFSGLMRKLVVNKPKEPLAFMIAALEQPVQQVRTQTQHMHGGGC